MQNVVIIITILNFVAFYYFHLLSTIILRVQYNAKWIIVRVHVTWSCSSGTDDDHVRSVFNRISVTRSVAVDVRQWFGGKGPTHGQRVPSVVDVVVAGVSNVGLRTVSALTPIVQPRLYTDSRHHSSSAGRRAAVAASAATGPASRRTFSCRTIRSRTSRRPLSVHREW